MTDARLERIARQLEIVTEDLRDIVTELGEERRLDPPAWLSQEEQDARRLAQTQEISTVGE